MEYCSIGVLEYWTIGALEYWSIGVLETESIETGDCSNGDWRNGECDYHIFCSFGQDDGSLSRRPTDPSFERLRASQRRLAGDSQMLKL